METPIQNVWRNRIDRPQTSVRRQLASTGAGFRSIASHQPLNAVQAARSALRQHILPDTSFAKRAITFEEAAADPTQQSLILEGPLAGRRLSQS